MELVLTNVSHRYAGASKASLSGVSLSLRGSQRLAIIGESGSGKSTLLGIAAGLILPTSGQARMDGRPVSSIPPAERGIGLAVQNPPNLPGVKVSELLLRPASRAGSRDARARVEHALVAVGLAGAFDRRLDSLSGGERQRCFLARVLVWQPKLMLLDEPFGSLDAMTKRSIIPCILEHQQAVGAALAIITHDPAEASLVAERFLLLRDGALVSEGPTSSAAKDPLTASGAAVFGGFGTNLVPGELTLSHSIASMRLLGVEFQGWYEGRAGKSVLVALEAESLILREEGCGTSPAIPLPAGVRWTPVKSGRLAVAMFDFGPIYSKTVVQPVCREARALTLSQTAAPVFDAASHLRIGTFHFAVNESGHR